MTNNEAYKYAKSIRRGNLSNIKLEKKMLEEGYSIEDFKLVKWWVSHGRVGV